MAPNNVLTEWASLLLASFADAGVRDIVISPGSRSTPLVVAAVREPRIRLHGVIDERAAAFYALGQARVTGRPSLLLCTSGSAGAHYLPALIEAQATFVPLLVLTADRPAELQDCTASQTIDQVKLFGGFVNRYLDLGVAEASADVLYAIRRMAAQSWYASLAPTPGPVHLNARIRKPLEPVVAKTPSEEEMVALARRVRAHPLAVAAPPVTVPAPSEVDAVARMLAGASRGLIAVGPGPTGQGHARDAILELARATGFPVVADATSQLRFAPAAGDVTFVDALEELAGTSWFRHGPDPDLVIQIGAPLVSAGWERLAAGLQGPRIVIAEHGWNDPQSRAERLVFGELPTTLAAIARAVGEGSGARAWAARLAEANAAYWDTCAKVFADAHPLTEGHVARIVARHVPPGSTWMLGNSLAVRAVNQYCPQGAAHAEVLSQRGAAGIDGLVAGAAGAASVSAQPMTLLLGDVSLLHDLTSLILAARATGPLVIVVLNNGGGRIFEQLPLGAMPDLEPAIMGVTVTAHAIPLEHAGVLFGIPWAIASDEASLEDALRAAYGREGCTVVEARLEEHGNLRIAKLVRAGLEQVLRGVA